MSFNWFHSVVVITSALHAEGPGFNPQWNQIYYYPLELPSNTETTVPPKRENKHITEERLAKAF